MAAPKVDTISRHTKLMIGEGKAIRLNYILVFAAILLAPSNLDGGAAISMALASVRSVADHKN